MDATKANDNDLKKKKKKKKAGKEVDGTTGSGRLTEMVLLA